MSYYKTEEEAYSHADEDMGLGIVEDFVGKNCDYFGDEECEGWFPGERRCTCGNRRVDWVAEQTTNGLWYISHAEAY